MIFDPDSYARFLDETKDLGLPILPATRVLTSKAQAREAMDRFKVRVPKAFMSQLPEKDDNKGTQGLEATLKLVEALRSRGAPGVQLFVFSETKIAAKAFKILQKL